LASLAPSSGATRHLLPLRRRRAGPAVAERCGKEALLPLRRRKAGPAVAERCGKEALLPFTGEGARRADEGARAWRSVPLTLPLARRATAARFARALIRRCAPPSPASQEKGWTCRRGKMWEGSPSPASREKG